MVKLLIPERHLSLLSVASQEELQSMIKKRDAASQFMLACPLEEYFQAEIDFIGKGLEYGELFNKHLSQALKDGLIAESQYEEARRDVGQMNESMEKEMARAKQRQKKMLSDALAAASNPATVTDLYMSLCGESSQKPKPRDEVRLRKEDCLEYYRVKDDDSGQAYCHLSGWYPAKDIIAAPIVPNTVRYFDRLYLFGVGYADLDDVRNSLSLHARLSEALDSGRIVFIPLPPKSGEETRWKCVVTDKPDRKSVVVKDTLWSDIDGRELTFLGSNRPSRRYLYFRFAIAFLHHHQLGNWQWESKVEAGRKMWASPGKYVRKSIFVVLDMKVGDYVFPEAFYRETTFSERSQLAADMEKIEDEEDSEDEETDSE